MSSPPPPPDRLTWPRHLAQLAQTAADAPENESARGDLWLLLQSAVSACLTRHEQSLGRHSPQDREDLISEKSLDLLSRIDSGQWKPQHSEPQKIYGYVSSAIRNGLVDDIRANVRKRRILAEPDTLDAIRPTSPSHANVEADQRTFAEALTECVGRLGARHRVIWIFRTFYDMPSKKIAVHPDVAASPGHVDVIQLECRKKITACMESKGLRSHDLPPGCFASLWEAFRAIHPGPEGDHVP